jgi:hypothetical protein
VHGKPIITLFRFPPAAAAAHRPFTSARVLAWLAILSRPARRLTHSNGGFLQRTLQQLPTLALQSKCQLQMSISWRTKPSRRNHFSERRPRWMPHGKLQRSHPLTRGTFQSLLLTLQAVILCSTLLF